MSLAAPARTGERSPLKLQLQSCQNAVSPTETKAWSFRVRQPCTAYTNQQPAACQSPQGSISSRWLSASQAAGCTDGSGAHQLDCSASCLPVDSKAVAAGSRLQLCNGATRAGSKGGLSSGDSRCGDLQLPGSLQGSLEGWQGGCSCGAVQLLRGGCLALCQLPTSLSCLSC